MVQKLLKDLTSPFRAFDVEEVQECLKEAGGADKLRLTYYKDGDIGDDKVWDIWKLEGPAFAWYFHGSPHVHTWVNIARKAPQSLEPRSSRRPGRPSGRPAGSSWSSFGGKMSISLQSLESSRPTRPTPWSVPTIA